MRSTSRRRQGFAWRCSSSHSYHYRVSIGRQPWSSKRWAKQCWVERCRESTKDRREKEEGKRLTRHRKDDHLLSNTLVDMLAFGHAAFLGLLFSFHSFSFSLSPPPPFTCFRAPTRPGFISLLFSQITCDCLRHKDLPAHAWHGCDTVSPLFQSNLAISTLVTGHFSWRQFEEIAEAHWKSTGHTQLTETDATKLAISMRANPSPHHRLQIYKLHRALLRDERVAQGAVSWSL